MFKIIPYDSILVKLASRCNLACKYCYWFRDSEVYKKPKILTNEAEDNFIIKLKKYLLKYQPHIFDVILHGGEPTLFGKIRLKSLCDKLKNLEKELNCSLPISITTNGILIDEEWANLFKTYDINVAISVDGDEVTNDSQRVDFKGKGTYSRIKKAITILKDHQIEPGVLAVCLVDSEPEDIYKGLVDDLDIKRFDVLIPDATYSDNPKPIYEYYKKLYDLWYDDYYQRGVSITLIECLNRGALGKPSLSNSIGYAPEKTITLMTDGSLEPLDYLRISSNGFTASSFNIFSHDLEDLQSHVLWKEVYESSLNLAEKCNNCKFKYPCGGGPIQTRWSSENRFNNPSVYCDDLYQLFDYVGNKIHKDLYVDKNV